MTHLPTRSSPLAHIANPKQRLDELSYMIARLEERPLHEFLIATLSDSYPPVRQHAARTLSQATLRPEHVELLMSLASGHTVSALPFMPSPSPIVALAALAALRDHRAPGLVELLLEQAVHPDADVRYQSLTNLFALRDELSPAQLLPVLERALQERDEEIAVIAAQFAAESRLLALRPEIERRMRETKKFSTLRTQFALSLGALLAPTETAPTDEALLEALFEEFEQGVRDEFSSAASSAALVDLALITHQRERAIKSLHRVLDRWLLHPLLKVEAAAQLTRLGDARGMSHLSDAISGKRKDTRGHALTLAGKLEIQPLYGQVVRSARDPDDYHNDTAILALANYDTPAARQELEALAKNHPDPELRQLSQRALDAPRGAPITFFSLEDQQDTDS